MSAKGRTQALEVAPEVPAADLPAKRSRPGLAALCAAIACLCVLPLLPGVTLGYWDRDEAEYAGVAHEMSQSGDFLIPRLFGRLYPDKPPFSEWLSTVSYRLLGESEVAGRLPHIVLSGGSCLLVFLLGKSLFGRRPGLVAATLLATSFLFLIYGRLFTTDAALLFFTLLTILCAHRVLQGRGGARAVVAGGVALGLAVLTKGPIAYLSPMLFAGGYWAASRRFRYRGARRMAALVGLSVLLAAPWFAAVAIATKGKSLGAFFLHENLYRFFHPMEDHDGPVFYYLIVLVIGFFPWSGALLVGGRALRRLDPVRWGLMAWGCGVLAFFSLSATKLPHYLLPALPAFALLAAAGAESRVSWESRALAWGMAVTGSAMFLAAVLQACDWDMPGVAGGLVWLFAAVAAASLAAPLAAASERTRYLVPAIGVAASLLLAAFSPVGVDRGRCLPRLGRAARLLRKANEPVGSLKLDEPALHYYAGSERALFWNDADDVVRAAGASPVRSVLVWLESASGPPLARDRRVRVQILADGLSLIEPTAQGKLELCRITAR